ncbi:serine/threonine protein kinase ATG1 [Aspergillus lucknowensis]|uniref:Serine/threonine-protein kinase ATG1 n=1 Tax=Aspergillus lucknowensis TaxID=176173 RepID=A0ABR4L5L6_9EURO
MASSQRPRSSKETYSEVPIGRYTRLDQIGRGSFATVYRGLHTKSQTFVAIKSVNLNKLNKKLKDNLSLEIDILKGLFHPHIVALIDCYENTSHIHLIMEYCALGDLSQFIKRRNSLSQHEFTRHMISKYPNVEAGALNEVLVRHFLKQLASSLKFLRERDLIHRDIKPQNLLLCPAPSPTQDEKPPVPAFKGSDDSFNPATGLTSLPLLKIADFGFARSLPATSLAETLCGSPLYMAPEILRYEKYDAKADLWSVGTVLYEMVVGKPPFRASNHVELLQKIEVANDRIVFPADNPASDEIKALIRRLLKRNPVERMSFADFFENNIITGPIPGLKAEDTPTPTRPSPEVSAREPTPRVSRSRPDTPQKTKSEQDTQSTQNQEEEQGGYPPPHRYIPHNERPQVPSTPEPMRRVRSGDKVSSAEKPVPAAAAQQRPYVVSHATAPGRQELIDRNQSVNTMERQRNRHTHSATPPADKTAVNEERERERAAQDVAFERDYVVVEKRAVEVNAFADELAHDPRIRGGAPKHAAAVPRRQTTPAIPTTTAASPQGSPSKAIQVITGRSRADSGHTRQGSYERRYGRSPTSATSAISKALHMASGRLLGMGFSPPLTLTKGGRSPPLGYNPFPAYPIAPAGLITLGDDSKPQPSYDEDTKTVKELEECATRSDVVYGFAEVKYKQLIPLAPSVQADGTPRPLGNDPEDGELTPDAVVTLSEEALVLYVKALALLAKSMDIAGAWWNRRNRGDALSESGIGRGDPNSILVGNRINKVVQWVRSRFNEVLEKAEFVRLKLIEAQKRLPTDHPSHPNNQSIESGGSGTSVDVVVSPGVTAEKLMYDRAVEMSRTAAIHELANEDLAGCEIAYVTAVRMLEAVLEVEEVSHSGRGSGSEGPDKIVLDSMRVEDREAVVKLATSIRARLTVLRKKLAILAKRQTPPPSGRIVPSNLAHATGATSPQ